MSLQAAAAGEEGLATGRAMSGRVFGIVTANGETESLITSKTRATAARRLLRQTRRDDP